MQVALRVARPGSPPESLTLEAASSGAAVRRVVSLGYRVLSVDEAMAPKVGPSRGTAFSLTLFSQELLALLEAGLTLVEALQALLNKETRPGTKAILQGLLDDLREGKNFSDVLSARPQHFPELYVATVRSAERSGNMPDALARYVAYQVQFDALRKKLISASIYPVMLTVVGFTVMFFLLGFVVPKFASVYASAGRPLPFLSGLLMSFGALLQTHWMWVTAAALFLAGLTIFLAGNAEFRSRVVEWVLRIPVLARRAKEFRLARFYRTLALLLGAGIPLVRGMAMAGGLFPVTQAASVALARSKVEEGLPFSAALQQVDMVTPIGLSLIQVGEKSGRLGDMLERAARFHDDDFARWVDWASRLLEPVLMVVMGLVIGTVVVLLYMPIFDLAETLQ